MTKPNNRFAPRLTRAGDKPGHYPVRDKQRALPTEAHYQPNRYDNFASVKGMAADEADITYDKAETHNREHFYAHNRHSVYKGTVQRMSSRLGSKSRYAARFKWSS